jgi:thiamine transport system permease protein
LIAPSLRRGMAFAAASCVGEFAVSLFLSRPEWTTLTTLIYQTLSRPGAANLEAALVLACLLMALSVVSFSLMDAQAQRGKPKADSLPTHPPASRRTSKNSATP